MHHESKFQQSLQSALPLTTSFVPRSNVYGLFYVVIVTAKLGFASCICNISEGLFTHHLIGPGIGDGLCN